MINGALTNRSIVEIPFHSVSELRKVYETTILLPFLKFHIRESGALRFLAGNVFTNQREVFISSNMIGQHNSLMLNSVYGYYEQT